jgi:uncharacterized damage-inducible protein DinB
MKKLFLVLALAGALPAQQQKKPQTLREVLLEQLHTTDDVEDWFVPIRVAVEGLLPEQVKWTDGKGGHSIGQLVNHMAFWNEQNLHRFQGTTLLAYNGDNYETFNKFDSKTWVATKERLIQVMKDWEKAVETADEEKLKTQASRIAHVGAHNAYHLGQIIYIRKLQGSWDPSKGVK